MAPVILVEDYIRSFSPDILWGIFGFVILLFIFISGILLYHWVTFTNKREQVIFLSSMYFGGAIFILGLFTMSLSLYIHSF